MKRAPGWWWRLPLLGVVLYGFFALSASGAGFVLGRVSDWIGGVR